MDAIQEWISKAPQRADQWNQLRLGRFTASDFYRLMTEPKSATAKANGELSEGALTYVNEKIAEELTGLVREDVYAHAKQWGIDNEPIGKEYFTMTTGIPITECGFVIFGDHAGASPDGLIGTDYTFELKCPENSANHIDILRHCNSRKDLKEGWKNYYWQCMFQMVATKRVKGIFASFDPRMPEKTKMKTVELTLPLEDEDLIHAKLIKAIESKLEGLNQIRAL